MGGYDPMLEKMRVADRNTYDSLLKQRAALQAHAARPSPASARAALEALRIHQAALENEQQVLGELVDAVKRSRNGLEAYIRTQGEEPSRPPLPPTPGFPMAFAPANTARVPHPY